MDDWMQIGGFVLAIFGASLALAKYINSRELKRNELQDERVDALFKNVNSDIDGIKKDVDENSLDLKRTREQMHNEFVKRGEIDDLRREIREDFNSIFKKMDSLSEGLNQLIGAIAGKVKSG